MIQSKDKNDTKEFFFCQISISFLKDINSQILITY